MENGKIHLHMRLRFMQGSAAGRALLSSDQHNGELVLIRPRDPRISFGCSRIDPDLGILYLCNEDDLEPVLGHHSGRIYGYRIDSETGSLTELFHQDTYCPCPDYIGFTPDHRFMIVPHHSRPSSVPTIQRDENGRYVPVTTCMDSAIDLFRMK